MSITDTRTCAVPGDQEHDHAMCQDAVAEAAARHAAVLAREQAAGLRALADMIEQNPDLVDVLKSLNFATHIFGDEDPQAKLAAFARVSARYARVEKRFSTNHAVVEAHFGTLKVSIQTDRAEVCERVVTGTETVIRMVPDPAALAAVPTVEVTEEVEQVEWRCRPLLADTAEAVAR